MSDNNLDDLILTEPESESSSNRGLLVILGLVVLLLILGVVLANIIFGSGNEDNATKEDVKSKPAHVISNNSNDSKLSITKTNSDATENSDLDTDLAPLDDKDNLVNSDMGNDDSINVKNDEPKDNTNDSFTAATTAAGAAAASKAVSTKKETPKVKHTTKPKKVQHKIKNIVTKPKPKKRNNTIRYSGNVYIQVGSFSKGPSAEFVNKIRRAGFKYRIKEVNGYRRVLIGPFESDSYAQRYLGTIKSKVSASAFIKR